MMLGHPEAAVAEPLGGPRELERVAQRPAGIGAFRDWGEIEDGKRDHAGQIGMTDVPFKAGTV
jgi:hypothetical protein